MTVEIYVGCAVDRQHLSDWVSPFIRCCTLEEDTAHVAELCEHLPYIVFSDTDWQTRNKEIRLLL